jgi:hypothetical protein
MNKKLLVNRMFLLASFLTIMLGASIVSTNGHVFAAKNIWDDDDTMEELVKDIDNGKDDDNSMNWHDFKNSKIFKQEDLETQECIKNRQELSNNLADYEVLRCFEDSDYAYDK